MKIVILQDKDLELTEIACTGIETISDIMDLCGISKMLGEGISSFTTADECTGIRIYSGESNDSEIAKILKEELRIYNFEFADSFYQQEYPLFDNCGKVVFANFNNEMESTATITIFNKCTFTQKKAVYDFLDCYYYDIEVEEIDNATIFQVSGNEFPDKKSFVNDIVECFKG